MVEGVGHRKLSAIIRVGHVKICRNFFKGMSIKIHIIKIEIKCIWIFFFSFIPQTLTSNLNAEFTVLANTFECCCPGVFLLLLLLSL
jgi:hypothetical protein